MANLVRKDDRDVARPRTTEHRWDPFRVMDALLQLDPYRGEWSGLGRVAEFTPRFDVKESKDAYVISADLPGLKDDQVEVSMSGNMLTIGGKREEETREESDTYFAMERSFGTFSRSFALPDGVDAEGVTAELKTGVLTVRIPKRAEAQPKRIAIGKTTGEGKAKA